jgi:hypothetical protein
VIKGKWGELKQIDDSFTKGLELNTKKIWRNDLEFERSTD